MMPRGEGKLPESDDDEEEVDELSFSNVPKTRIKRIRLLETA